VSLSCGCGYDDYDWYYNITEIEYVANSVGKCYGCGNQIRIGEEVAHIDYWECDEDGNEENEEVLGRICETCWDMKENLEELGFCLTAEPRFIADAMKEYREYYAVIK